MGQIWALCSATCVWEQPWGTVSTEGEGVISQSRFCDDVRQQPVLSSSCGVAEQHRSGASGTRAALGCCSLGSLTHHFLPPAKGKGVGGSCFSMCVSSCLLPFSLPLPVYSSAFLRATVPDQLLAVIEMSLFLTVFIPYKPCVTC